MRPLEKHWSARAGGDEGWGSPQGPRVPSPEGRPSLATIPPRARRGARSPGAARVRLRLRLDERLLVPLGRDDKGVGNRNRDWHRRAGRARARARARTRRARARDRRDLDLVERARVALPEDAHAFLEERARRALVQLGPPALADERQREVRSLARRSDVLREGRAARVDVAEGRAAIGADARDEHRVPVGVHLVAALLEDAGELGVDLLRGELRAVVDHVVLERLEGRRGGGGGGKDRIG
jgi:hypothetical protein